METMSVETEKEIAAATALILLFKLPPISPSILRDQVSYSSHGGSLETISGHGSSLECTSSSSCVSELSSSGVQIHGVPLHMLALAACLNQNKPKVPVKKARSKIRQKMNNKLLGGGLFGNSGKEKDDVEVVMEMAGTSSSISSSCTTTAESETRSYPRRMTTARLLPSLPANKTNRKKISTSTSASRMTKRQAEAIMDLLSSIGSATELRIRAALGDSPDTSKALRMLLKIKEVKRAGCGGPVDPFVYMWLSSVTGHFSQ